MKYIKIIGILSSIIFAIVCVILSVIIFDTQITESYNEIANIRFVAIFLICKILFYGSLSFCIKKEGFPKIRVYIYILITIYILWIISSYCVKPLHLPIKGPIYLSALIIYIIISIKILVLQSEKKHILKPLKGSIISMYIAYFFTIVVFIYNSILARMIMTGQLKIHELLYQIPYVLLILSYSVPYVFGLFFFVRIGDKAKG